MSGSQSMPEKVNKISVLHKMNSLAKKIAGKEYVVPHNSVLNLQQKPGLKDPITMTENSYDRSATSKCPHCENMAKNFLYLESLIRNNYDKKQNCSLCNSSLKYLQYVNRNIMQVFGNFDSIVQAAKAFSTQAPPLPKYAPPARPAQPQVRAKGGANIALQKPSKSQKSVKQQKSNKSLKSAKSGKSLTKQKSKSSGTKGGKMVLKHKYKAGVKTAKLTHQLSKVVRSASQYQNLRVLRSKLNNKAKKQKKLLKKQSPTIPWGLLKKNLPKRKVPGAK